MVTALARAMNASITRLVRSVQIRSFLKPRLCQELVRSTTQLERWFCLEWVPLMLITPVHPNSLSRSRVLPES